MELHVAHAIESACARSASRQRHWMSRVAAASCTFCTSSDAFGAAFGTGAAEAEAAGREFGGGAPLSRRSLDVDGAEGAGVGFSSVGT